MVLFVAATVLTGCGSNVVMQNPRTGATNVCRDSLRGLNPWSQTMACVADHEAQGWVRVVRE